MNRPLVKRTEDHLVIDFYLGSVVKILANGMSLNPFVDTNQVVVEILDGLRGENIQKPFDSELILIQDIIKG